ncbi:DgyrCDS13576 [Dimorphilus gyrociliatus]|uniref:DgyrCDS13576 n=1 Tax=Dimorphilus gyrociliatus TaxID=2664684 RepID=A0A7I8WB19_9ANNE|nr:DgyrCDS13576 [Dimorphilus gyrociliatus]
MNESLDVLISHSKEDIKHAEYIADGLNKSGIVAYHSAIDSATVKSGLQKNDAIVKAKVFLLILSPYSTKDERLKDEVALAYISNKPVFPIALKHYSALAGDMDSALKLMLAKINWTFLTNKTSPQDTIDELISQIKYQLKNISESPSTQATVDKFDAFQGLNKNRENREEDDEKANNIRSDFWQINFQDKNEIQWQEFRDAFIKEYEEKICKNFGFDRVNWFCELLFDDVFEKSLLIEKAAYQKFIGDKEFVSKDTFYQRLRDYGIGMLAMKEVFDMKSSVRITAVQKLGSFQTISVRSALLDLTYDNDPNIRAVSALGLAKTGRKDDWIIRRLTSMLNDNDRVVRESACLSLGHMKCTKAVSNIIDVWRNDPIKHVREAAQVALSRMGGEEANKAMKMVEVLSNEMKN